MTWAKISCIDVGMKEMMIKKTIIKEGTHAPFRIPKLILNPYVLEHKVTFTESCRYDIGEDQTDINKLFGIGYFPFHHINSVRIGWAYNISTDTIKIYAYWYKNKERKWLFLRDLNIGQPNTFKISIREKEHVIFFNQSFGVSIDVPGQPIGYLLRPYFGGNKKAPHDITIIGL